MNIEIGQSICDMHDGAPDGCVAHVRIRTDSALDIARTLMCEATMDDRFVLCNKILYVQDVTISGIVKCVYAYDGRYFGIVTIDEKVLLNRRDK